MKILFIGGTGMLKKALDTLISENHNLFITTRNSDLYNRTPHSHYFQLDWSTKASIDLCLAKLKLFKDFDLMISWIHSDGIHILTKFEDLLNRASNKKSRSIRIHGSSVGDPSLGIQSDPIAPSHVIRQNIVLGHIVEHHKKRWLTHDEISSACLFAFKNPQLKNQVVGKL